MTEYPRPNRSTFSPNFHKTDHNPALDIGWSEGTLSDGRPYRAECWAEVGITSLTYFLSTAGLERFTDSDFAALLEQEGLLRFTSDKRFVAARPFTDASGNAMWSVNVVVGDDETTFVVDGLPLRSYSR